MEDKEYENALDDEMFNTWRDKALEKENIRKEEEKQERGRTELQTCIA